jgi:hypothetical protein
LRQEADFWFTPLIAIARRQTDCLSDGARPDVVVTCKSMDLI